MRHHTNKKWEISVNEYIRIKGFRVIKWGYN